MQLARQFGTNWFTASMGVGIVAALTYTSPVPFFLNHALGIALFLAVNVVFFVSIGLWTARWCLHTDEALEDFRHPARALFYGALAMAINVLGNDYLLIGSHLMNPAVAIAISRIIWVVGVSVSLFTVVIVPYLLFVEHQVETKDALASWLIPVVPPIVAAATGVNLIPYWGGASAQFSITVILVAMFGLTFFLFLMVSALVYSRLVYHHRLSGEATPSLWVEIGPIGMSMALFSTLPFKAQAILGSFGPALHAFGLIFSIAMWGVGVWWIVIAGLHTLHQIGKRGEGLPFGLGWWSYVFPIGSFTSGTYALAHLLPYAWFTVTGAMQLGLLWLCFAIVFSRTVHGVWAGSLLRWRRDHHLAHLHPAA